MTFSITTVIIIVSTGIKLTFYALVPDRLFD